MNPRLSNLHPYPFEKLKQLKQGVKLQTDLHHIALSIGEPQHPMPELIRHVLVEQIGELTRYPPILGLPELREAISRWLETRFLLGPASVDPERHILPVSGTREALFSFAQALINSSENPLVLMPNPFYQIYEGAALLAGAEPRYLDMTAENHFLPDLDSVTDDVWKRCSLIYICNPGNPTGAVMDLYQLKKLIGLALRHQVVIACDECYSEIYRNENNPPPGLLQAAREMGNDQFENCVVFNSLSKRSNVPGLRSGFVAGDPGIIRQYARYRSYHGCTMPLPTQKASIAAWSDENHVRKNRALYRQKFLEFAGILADSWSFETPEAGFYLWPKTPGPDTDFARELFARQNISVLPGRFLSRDSNGLNPGKNRVRIALVQPLDECVNAAQRIRNHLQTL
ncbi:succinyldiaminopimelate transaminase [Marinobacter nauticus]|uniref:succinyldiaminopimelate transaminase n=1 Tax=Marinobacter nauticus TaxID=2743 RepID=UPI00241EEFB0|nr:succinyldiaminopimelate transaminase [Marinobacter nauticus]